MEDGNLVPYGEESAIAFCVRKPRKAHGVEIWTRHGHREVSQETFEAHYREASTTITVPDALGKAVRSAWQGPKNVQEALTRLLTEDGHVRISPR
jgi:hypothetical protein